MDNSLKRRLQRFCDEIQEISDQRKSPFDFGIITSSSETPIHSKAVWRFAQRHIFDALRRKRIGRRYFKPFWVDPFPDGSASLWWAGDEDAVDAFKKWSTRLSNLLRNHPDICPELPTSRGYHSMLWNFVGLARSTDDLAFLAEKREQPLVDLSDVEPECMTGFPPAVRRQDSRPSFGFHEILCHADVFGSAIAHLLLGEPFRVPRLSVDRRRNEITLDGRVYPLDIEYVVLLDVLVKANGSIESFPSMKEKEPVLKEYSRITRILDALKKTHPDVYEVIERLPTQGYCIRDEFLA